MSAVLSQNTQHATEHTKHRPSVLHLGISRIGYEVRSYFRSTDAVFFTFLFPVIMLGIFTSAFSAAGNIGAAPDGTGGISVAQRRP